MDYIQLLYLFDPAITTTGIGCDMGSYGFKCD
jgi:hypothetical protein